MSDSATAPTPQIGSLTLAAVDLGSNSFHMVVMRQSEAGLQVVDRVREPVRLASGLLPDKSLNEETRARALECLGRFGQILRGLPGAQVRVLGTNTLRRLRPNLGFFADAEEALGHPIEVISGVEEARLIYGGVVHGLSGPDERRLVVDIGGGSTELIIGEGAVPQLMESVHMGCVSFTQRYFADGKLSAGRLDRARTGAAASLQFLSRQYRQRGWERSIGASGSVRSVWRVAVELGHDEDYLDRAGLESVRDALIQCGRIEKVSFADLRDDRQPVFAGSWAVLAGVFDAMRIEQMDVSDRALREGAIYDLMGRLQDEDVRDDSVRRLADRFAIDAEQAQRVAKLAQRLFEAMAEVWSLDPALDLPYLNWAAQLHETGLAISHSSFHKHGAYVLSQADMHGFSRRDQMILAALVRCHRGKLRAELFADLPPRWSDRALRLAVILRVAVVLNRSRKAPFPLHDLYVRPKPKGMRLEMPAEWHADHALTVADIEAEAERLRSLGIKLKLKSAGENA